MSRRGDNIHKRSDGRWEGRYKIGFKADGKTKYRSVYASTYKECKNKLEQAKLLTNHFNTHHTETTFSYVLYKWFESKKIKLKGSTQIKYLNLIEKHICPALGRLQISKINSITINTFLEEKIKNGSVKGSSELSASYVKTMAIIIESVIKYAVDEGLCVPLKSPIYKPAIMDKEPIVFSKEEEISLMNLLSQDRSNVSIAIMLSLMAGLRLGEICALTWNDIDFLNDIIHVRHTISRVIDETKTKKTTLIITSPKTNSSLRNVPMTRKLKEVLLDAYRLKKSEFVVSNSPMFVDTRTIDYQYRKLLNKNNLKIYNFHSLRHTFATRCAQSGMDAKTISQLLGHSSVTTTLNVYVHPSMETTKQQVNQVFDYV